MLKFNPESGRFRRRGGVTLELIIAMPVFVIMTFAIIEFGVFFANMQIVEHAARVGAREASETAVLPAAGPVPANVLAEIDQDLNSSNITRCKVRLEHNVGGGGPFVLESGACPCGPNAVLGSPPPDEYVRLTICVEMSQLTPNLLSNFGFDIDSPQRFGEATVVMRHEL